MNKVNLKKQSIEQQTIAIAAAGDTADCDNLISTLAEHAKMREYEASLGCDVNYVFNGLSNDDESFYVGNNGGLDMTAIGYLARGEISSALRSNTGQLRVCLLIAGMVQHEEQNEASLFKDNKNASSILSQQIQMQIANAVENFEEKVTQGLEKEDEIKLINPYLKPRLLWLDETGSIQKIPYGVHGFASNFAFSILDQNYRPNLTRMEACKLIKDCFDQLRERYVINSPYPPYIKCIDASGCQSFTSI
jgi:hypothetical protein